MCVQFRVGVDTAGRPGRTIAAADRGGGHMIWKYIAIAVLATPWLANANSGASNDAGIASAPERVVLLHGLGRHATSMSRMAKKLERAGFEVCNVDYASFASSIEEIARTEVLPAIDKCWAERPARIHFVTHSLGGILVRQLVADGTLTGVGRVVMLGPPNQGSELADRLGAWKIPPMLHPPAAAQLTTADGALPRRLGAAPFELGVIAGDRSVNPFLSLLIPGPDDGKVSVAASKVDGMTDFVLIHTSHTFMMNRDAVIAQTVCFLRNGAFADDAASLAPCMTTRGSLHCASPTNR